MDETTAYNTEWGKSEREIEISYTDTHIWNIERWYWWIYFQGSSGKTDIENRLRDTGRWGDGWGWDVWREQHGNLNYYM